MENAITYSFDDLRIVGVTKNGIYATTDCLFIDDPNSDDIMEIEHFYLLFTPRMWTQLHNEWINHKERYCTHYGHFCGWGSIHSQYEIWGSANKMVMTNNEFKMIEVNVYKVKDILVDMEHG